MCLIDQYFLTTSPDVIKTKISNNKLNFLPIPVDSNIEKGTFYDVSKTKDLFFAIFQVIKGHTSRTVNYSLPIFKLCLRVLGLSIVHEFHKI